MRYRVLGPIVAVGDEGRRARLGGPKQRAVLAFLLRRRGRIVGSDEIIDGIWGDQATAGSRRSLQTYVSELRGLVDDPIVHDRGGYRLEAAASSVDAVRFEELVTAARTEFLEHAEQRTTSLREALGLWRGRAYGEVGDLQALRPEVTRLEQLRVDALEERIDADLALGRHMAVIEELDALVREHPFRERLWAMRMLAQYRAGRQAHALDTFDRAAALLREELGLDPGPPLRALRERILRQDPTLQSEASPGPAEAAPLQARGLEVRELVADDVHTRAHRAFQASMGRIVTLRVVMPDVANSPGFVHRFQDVTRKWASLDHPHVLRLLDAWRDPDGAHLVTPFLEDDVSQRLAGTDLPAPAALRVVDETAQAVAHLHRHGMAHGALAPAGIRLDEDGHARVADAGLAMLLGTPEAQDDLVGLADLAHRLLAGQATGVDDVVTAGRRGDYERIADFRRDLRRAAGADVVAMAMAVPTRSTGVRNPFKGLRPFLEDDADDFFGRESLVGAVLDRLGRAPFVALVGPSGTGKSSLVRAGVLPGIRANDETDWLIAELFPSTYPFDELLNALRSVAVEELDVTAADLARDDRALVRAVKQAVPRDDVLLLFVDQLEEVFSSGTRTEDRDMFLASLAAAAEEAHDRLRIIVTLRGDFFEHGLQHPEFAPLLARETVPVGIPSPAELAAAIARPAHEAGLELEPGLVDEIVADHREQPGGLPMLQYACTELVEHRDGAMLTRAAYRASGGVDGALERRAEEVFHSLSVAAAGATEAVFLRLVTVRTDGQDVRRRVHRTELDALHGESVPVSAVLTAFGAARLLTFDRDPVTRSPTVEIAHDALLTTWPRLRSWLDDRLDDVVSRQRLHAAVTEWEESGRDAGFLLVESRLAAFEDWAGGTAMALTPTEEDYLAASRRAVERSREEERARGEHERRLEERSASRTRAIAVVSVVAAIVATGLSVFAFGERDRATEEQRRAEVQELIAASRELAATATAQLSEDPELSILLAIEAVERTRRVDGTVLPEAESTLRRALQASRIERSLPAGSALAVAPDGRVATLSVQGQLTIWASGSADPQLELDGQVVARDLRQRQLGPVDGIDFSPDGERIVVADAGHRGHVRDAGSGQSLVVLDHQVSRPQFGPRGERIAAVLVQEPDAGQDAARTLGVWDATTGRLLRRLEGHTRNIEGLAFAPDGEVLATASQDGTRVWDVATGEVVWSDGTTAYSVAVAPDGRQLAVGTQDGGARLHDLGDGAVVDAHPGAGGVGLGIAYAPDGSRLAVSSGAEVTTVWHLSGTAEPIELHRPGLVAELAFTADGTHLLTTTHQNETHTWDLGIGGSTEYGVIPSLATPTAMQLAVAPSQPRLAVSGPEGDVGVWDLDRMESMLTLDPELPVHLVAYSGDGRTIATAGVRGQPDEPPGSWSDEIDVWNAATGAHRGTLTGMAAGWRIALDSDGSTVAHAAGDGVLQVLDTSTGEVLHRYVHETGQVYTVAFSPDDALLAVGAQDAGFVLDTATWDRATDLDIEGSVVDTRFPSDDRVLTVELASRLTERSPRTGDVVGTFARDGNGLLTADRVDDLVAIGDANGVTVRDTTTGRQRLGLSHDFGVTQLRFVDGGRYLAAYGAGRAVQLHVMEIADLLDLARDRVTRSLTNEECQTHLRGPCP